MEATRHSNRKTARLAATLFFFISIPLSPWDQFYVPQQIVVAQNPVATANNLLAHEFLFRTAIVSHFIGIFFFVWMILLFARIFRPVDKHLAQSMAVSAVAQLPILFVFEVVHLAALMMLKSEPRPTFTIAHQQEIAYFLLRVYRYGVGPSLGKLFFGLSFIPFGLVVLRSGFTPRIVGMLLIIGGVGYVADCCSYILLQHADYLLVQSVLKYTALGYILALLWFLIQGRRELKSIEHK